MENKHDTNKIPRMIFGKYKGKRIDQIPHPYLRWMLGQKFPEEILKYARIKVGPIKPGIDLDISGHAMDQFSLRHINLWSEHRVQTMGVQKGIHRFLQELSLKALSDGVDVSKKRHQDEQLIMLYQGIKFVFNRIDDEYGLRCLVTVM